MSAAIGAGDAAGPVDEKEVGDASPAEHGLAGALEGGDFIRAVVGEGAVKRVGSVAKGAFSTWIWHRYFDIDAWKGSEEVELFC